jgi:hypothetical protein
VKHQRLLVENVALDKFIKKLKNKERLKEKNPVVQEPKPQLPDAFEVSQREEDQFTGKIPEECFMAEYTEEDLSSILDQQQKLIDFLKQQGKTKHLANRILFLFDDLVGSSLFSGARKNPFKMLNTVSL